MQIYISNLTRTRRINHSNNTFKYWIVSTFIVFIVFISFRIVDIIYIRKEFYLFYNTNVSYFRLNYGIMHVSLATWLLQNFYIDNAFYNLPENEIKNLFETYKRTEKAFLSNETLLNYENLLLYKYINELTPFFDLHDSCLTIADQNINCVNLKELSDILVYNYKRPLVSILNVIDTLYLSVKTTNFDRMPYMRNDFINKVKNLADSLFGYVHKIRLRSKNIK